MIAAPLFQPLSVRGLTLPNRTVMAPMGRMFAQQGVPHPDAAAYYARRAQGGAGLIITEATGIDHPLSTDHPGIPIMYGEAALAGWRGVVEAVHAAGGLIVPQLFHQGMLRGGSFGTVMDSLRPSGLVGDHGPHTFAEGFVEALAAPTAPMSEEDIADVVAAFARSAASAVRLGFDGIALHGAHGYVIDSFLWAASNRRDDRFGGDQRQRTRFAVEVIKAVRAEMPAGMPLFFRFSQHKSHNYDARVAETPGELEAMLGPLVEAGVDVLDASIRRFWQPAFDGSPLNLAGWAKKLTGKPSIAVGSIGLSNTATDTFMKNEAGRLDNIPLLMERFGSGEFDLVSIGRSLIGDPDFVAKLRSGEPVIPFARSALTTLE
jgi:2,4-dienoyl-CoA reductase-like NADH-dependent reductase (Old Yellow Enzyme family)